MSKFYSFLKENFDELIKKIDYEKTESLLKIAQEKISYYHEKMKNNPFVDGWKTYIVNDAKDYPNGMILLDKPIRVIMKDKWGELYHGFMWGWKWDGYSKRILCEIVANKIEKPESYDSNFLYGPGWIKWSETKIKVPKNPNIPHWDELNT